MVQIPYIKALQAERGIDRRQDSMSLTHKIVSRHTWCSSKWSSPLLIMASEISSSGQRTASDAVVYSSYKPGSATIAEVRACSWFQKYLHIMSTSRTVDSMSAANDPLD